MDNLFMNAIPFTTAIFSNRLPIQRGGKPVTYRREGCKHQFVTFSANTISMSISKCFKGQRFKEVIGHWPAMSIQSFDKIARQRISDIETGHYNKAASLLVGDFFIDYVLPEMESRNRDIKSVKTRWRRVMSTFAHKPLGDITRLYIEQFLVGLSKEVKCATVNRHLALLSRIFSSAVSLDIIIKNPCSGIKKWPENNIRDRVLSQEEIRIYVLEALDIDTSQSRALLLSLFLGLRIGNAVSIKRSMLDASLNKLHLPITKNGRAYTISLNEPARQIIKQCLATTWNDWLFPSAVNGDQHIASPRYCHAHLRDLVLGQVVGSTHFNIHDLRRTYASRQLALTGDARLVQSNLFHQSVTTTERYAFHEQPRLADASQQTAQSFLVGLSLPNLIEVA
jgi:integrase